MPSRNAMMRRRPNADLISSDTIINQSRKNTFYGQRYTSSSLKCRKFEKAFAGNITILINVTDSLNKFCKIVILGNFISNTIYLMDEYCIFGNQSTSLQSYETNIQNMAFRVTLLLLLCAGF